MISRWSVTVFARDWGWLAFTLLALSLFLGTRGFTEPDEGRYAEIGREMLLNGDWLVPHLNGFQHFQKPPLLYWLTAGGMSLLGVNEWGARLPSALAALGTVLLTFAMARRLWSREIAVIAALVLVSSVQFFVLARMLTPDMLLTFWITAAIAAATFRRPWWFFACMGLGFLTKGPMALVVPLFAVTAWQRWSAPADRLKLPWGRGLLVTFGIGVSWFAALSFSDPALLDYFWKYELVQRFGSSAHGRAKPFWFFVPILLGGFLPWTVMLPAAARAAWGRVRAKTLTAEQALLLGWTIPPFIILSLSGSKLLTYVLPLFPALALAVAVRLQGRTRVAWRMAVPAVAILLGLAAFADRFHAQWRQQASVRPLARAFLAQPDAASARIFACTVRAHGWEFYTGRLASVTRKEADVVLPTTAEQSARLFKSAGDLEEAMRASSVPVYGIVRPGEWKKVFAGNGWREVARTGDFILITQPLGL